MDYIYISDFFGLEFRTKIRRTRDGQSQNFLTTTSSVHNLHAVGRWLAWKTSAAATAKEGERDGVSEQTGVGAHGSRGLLRSPLLFFKVASFFTLFTRCLLVLLPAQSVFFFFVVVMGFCLFDLFVVITGQRFFIGKFRMID